MGSDKQTENQNQIPPQYQPYPPQYQPYPPQHQPYPPQHQQYPPSNFPPNSPPIYHPSPTEENPDHLILSILTLLFCWCFCLTIPALVYSIKSRDSYRRGRFDDANSKGKKAKNLAIAAIIFSIFNSILWLWLQWRLKSLKVTNNI